MAQSLSTWLEIRSRWSKLRELGQSNLVKASVLMPVFGYLLLLNDNVHQYLTIQYDAGWPFNRLPSMWRVWMLFYGSFFVAMGSLLFAWRCPTEVKRYASEFQMVDTERDQRGHQYHTEHTTDELRVLYTAMSQWENTILNLPKLQLDRTNLGIGTSPDLPSGDALGGMLTYIWKVHNIKWPKWRIFIYLLFRAGIILLAVPAGFTFLQVTLLVAKHIL
jgi:hypothetical protein